MNRGQTAKGVQWVSAAVAALATVLPPSDGPAAEPPRTSGAPSQVYVIDRGGQQFSMTMALDSKMVLQSNRVWVVVPGLPFKGGRVDFAVFALLGEQHDFTKRETVFSNSQAILPVEEAAELMFELPALPDGRYLARAKATMYGREEKASFEALREQLFIQGADVSLMKANLEKAVVEVDGYSLNQVELSKEQMKRWRAAMKDIATVEVTAVYIEGHTCHRGTRAANDIVATRRAENVAALVQEMGIPPAKVRIVSLTDSAPVVVSEKTEAEARKNRRVLVRVIFRRR
ncbi:MAG: OmpA family protein [Deltaproteobacteria bacterium]|nr:OmpA family protein [Deltaproteobacteria bacterium]